MAGTVADLLSTRNPTPAPPAAAPSVAPLPSAGSDSAAPPPPPGFVLDNGAPLPPPGFQIEARPQDSGLGANIAQGASEGVQFNGGLIRDALINPRGIIDRVQGMVGQVFGDHPAPSAPGLGALAAMPADAIARKQSQSVVAATPIERIARSAAAGATGGLINPEGVASTVAEMLGGAAVGTGSGVAQETVPDNLKPVAAVVGGALVPAGAAGARALTSGAARVAEPVLAGVSPKAAEAAAARTLATRATDPQAAAAALEPKTTSVWRSKDADYPIEETGAPTTGPDGRSYTPVTNKIDGTSTFVPTDEIVRTVHNGQIVPGSQPTTYQQTGDPGLGELEREAQTRSPGAFNERRGEQNAARVTALGDIQQGADPNDVAATLRQHFDDLDAAHEEAVNAAAKAAQDKAAQFGGQLPPDQYGAIIRDAMHTGERGAAAHVSSFYDAIDPNGDLTGNLKTTREGAQQIAEKVGPMSMPMTGEEADIFAKAGALPDLGPAQDLIELRKYVNAVARKPDVAGTPTSARLTQLRGVIDDNLANTISQQIANEQPLIERGIIDPSQSMAAHVQSQVDAWRAQRSSSAVADRAGTDTAAPGVGASAVPGVDGAESLGMDASGAGETAQAPGVPSFDEAARQRLITANQAAREKAKVWGPKAIEAILAKDGNGNFRVPDGKVAESFFHPGPSGFEHMQQALKASPESLPALVDYAATTLRRAAMKEDGTIDPAKFEQWRSPRAYADALRALPEEAKAKFADAATAGQTLADARAAKVVALKAADSGAIARVMKLTEPEDVTKAIGSILTGRTAVADMKQLALATKGEPQARAGLRQAVADYMAKKLIGNTEVGTSGVAAIKGDAYQTFIKTARPALHLIFSPEEVRTMEAIGEDIQRANRSINSKPAGTPGSAHDVLAGIRKAAAHGNHSLLTMLAAVGAESHGGLLVGVAAGIGAHLAQMLRGAGVRRIDELVTQAMLHPHIAAELLKKAPPTLTEGSLRSLTVALVKSIPASNAAAHSR